MSAHNDLARRCILARGEEPCSLLVTVVPNRVHPRARGGTTGGRAERDKLGGCILARGGTVVPLGVLCSDTGASSRAGRNRTVPIDTSALVRCILERGEEPTCRHPPPPRPWMHPRARGGTVGTTESRRTGADASARAGRN